MKTHAPHCPVVSSPEWECRYSNHDFDACKCQFFHRPELVVGNQVRFHIADPSFYTHLKVRAGWWFGEVIGTHFDEIWRATVRFSDSNHTFDAAIAQFRLAKITQEPRP